MASIYVSHLILDHIEKLKRYIDKSVHGNINIYPERSDKVEEISGLADSVRDFIIRLKKTNNVLEEQVAARGIDLIDLLEDRMKT